MTRSTFVWYRKISKIIVFAILALKCDAKRIHYNIDKLDIYDLGYRDRDGQKGELTFETRAIYHATWIEPAFLNHSRSRFV